MALKILILTRSWTNVFGRKYPIGQKMRVDNQLGQRLLDENYAKEFNGVYKSKEKVRTDFFKPKNEK